VLGECGGDLHGRCALPGDRDPAVAEVGGLDAGQRQQVVGPVAVAGAERDRHRTASVRGQRRRRVTGDELAPVHDGDAVTQHLRLVHEVRDQHDRRAAVADLADQLPGGVAGAGVQAGGQLVEQHQLRVAEQRECDEQPLLLTTRQRPERAVAQRLEVPCRDGRLDVDGDVACVREEPDRLDDPQPLRQRGGLQLGADAAAQLVLLPGGVEPQHRDPPTRPVAETLEGLHDGCLAGSVGAEDAEDLAPPDLERDVVNRHPRSIGLAEILHGNDGVHAR
jgi:hypothetical protein